MNPAHIAQRQQAGERAQQRKAVKLYWQRAAEYARQNIEAARIILSRAGEFGGPQSGLCRWAQLTLWRSRRERRAA